MLLRSILQSTTTRYSSTLGPRRVSQVVLSPKVNFQVATSIKRAIGDGKVDTGYNIFTTFHAESSVSPVEDSSRPKRTPGRFLAHVLLHSLLRNNRAHAAASFAKLCMERGIRIRESTFVKVFAAISPPNDPQLSPLRTKAGSSQTRPPPLTAAISLLAAARKSNHKQHPWMYDRVLSALLLQGEVLTAALLFATLVREWNARKRLDQIELPEDGILSLDEGFEVATGIQEQEPGGRSCVPKPEAAWMHQLIKALRVNRHDPASKIDQHQAIRGLSVLGSLLWDHVPFVPSRSHLIKAVAETPRELHSDVLTHDLWHRRLEELCSQSLTSVALDSASYHSLLHYSLRQRRSLDLASRVLDLLCTHHRPTSATYNILIREATKMRDDDFSLHIRGRLSTRSTNFIALPRRTARKTTGSLLKIMDLLARFSVPTTDEYTSIALMLADVSAGDIVTASKPLFLLFPLLNQPTPDGKRDLGLSSATQRARSLSPHFWAAAVHIASKAYSLRLSMRIWRLVKRAEKAASADGGVGTRLYGVEAYTTHLGLFHKRLLEIERDTYRIYVPSQSATNVDERIPRLFTLYEWILRNLHAVLRSLRDSIVHGLKMDELLVETLLNLANLIFKLENVLPRLAHPALSSMQRTQHFDDADSQFRVRRILGVLRMLLSSPSQRDLPQLSMSPEIVDGGTARAYPEWWYEEATPTRQHAA